MSSFFSYISFFAIKMISFQMIIAIAILIQQQKNIALLHYKKNLCLNSKTEQNSSSEKRIKELISITQHDRFLVILAFFYNVKKIVKEFLFCE